MIFCLSNHHTGTWSTLGWVHQHDSVKGLITSAHTFDCLEGREESITHRMESGNVEAKWDPGMVYHEHIHPDNSEEMRINRTQVLLATMFPTVIPIRDPLATMIRYEITAERDGRKEEEGQPRFDPIGHHLDRWVRLARTASEIFQRFAHIRFLCWDLLPAMDRFEVVDHLMHIAGDLGLRDGLPSVDCAKDLIRNNTFGEYPLKSAYKAGDLETLRKGISNGGFDALREAEGTLRPFLEGLGYQDLLWWSG